jgi:hypothetical protein
MAKSAFLYFLIYLVIASGVILSFAYLFAAAPYTFLFIGIALFGVGMLYLSKKVKKASP